MTQLMDKLRKLAAAVIVAFAAPACSTAHEPALADIAVPEIAPTDAIPGPGLWKVSDDDTTIYLFGTIHFLPEGVDWFDQRISTAFNASSEFVTEIDLENQVGVAAAVQSMALLSDGQTLRGLLPEEGRNEYDAALVSLGMPVESLDMYEPWFAAVNLELIPLMQAGYDPNTGVEMILSGRADGKDRQALETIEQQLGLFDNLPLETQISYLDGVVESVPTVAGSMSNLLDAWAQGDTTTIVNLMTEGMQDETLEAALLTNRNANWAQWVEQRLTQPGDVFIAVGAAHLAGGSSVQQMLTQRGIAVSRVW